MGKCVYQAGWSVDSKYRDWIAPLKSDRYKALCRVCAKVIDLAAMGESALRSHIKSIKHQRNMKSQAQ